MAHFSVCIIIRNDGSSPEQLADRAIEAINAFNYTIPSEPYKEYVDQEQLEGLKQHLETDDLETLRREAENLYAEACFIDEAGIYYLSEEAENPNGHFSSGDLLGLVPPEDFGTAFLGKGGGRVCLAVVTLDGTWLEGPMYFGDPTVPEWKQAADEWDATLRSLIETHTDAVFFLADCRR
jgi:hypothetical protein